MKKEFHGYPLVGGDSVDAIKARATAGGHGYVTHWSNRKTRDLAKSIPKDTEAVVVVLDRISHARTDATRRGLPVFFQKRGRQIPDTEHHLTELTQLFTIHKH